MSRTIASCCTFAYLFLIAMLCSAQDSTTAVGPVQQAEPSPILIDWIHANDYSMIGLGPKVYDYHVTCGYRHAFEYLKSKGFASEYAASSPLNTELLSQRRLLFINLPSAEKEPFLVSEIMAIRRFVESGGSLLVITDHSNCYFHAHRLKPLFTELGITIPTDMACDRAPHTLSSGNGWIAVTRFAEHPVTKGVGRLGIQTGGCVDPRFAVAWTSDRSWADQWETEAYGEKNAPGFFGDFQQNPGESNGPLGVVLAKNIGQGRVVVVADQNIFSNGFINYVDNFQLWLNLTAWLLHDPRLADPQPYIAWKSPRLALYEPSDSPKFGSDDNQGYFYALSLLSRYYWTFAHYKPISADTPADLLIFVNGKQTLPQAEATDRMLAAKDVVAYLKSGRNVLILPPTETSSILDASNQTYGTTMPPLVSQLLATMQGMDYESHQTPGKTVINFQQGGAIHIMTSGPALDNRELPSPTKYPSYPEQIACDRLLEAVKAALPSGKY